MNDFSVGGRKFQCSNGRLLRPHSREAKHIAKHLAWCCRRNPDAVGMFCDAERFDDDYEGCPFFSELHKNDGEIKLQCKDVSEGHWTRLLLEGKAKFYAHDEKDADAV